MKKNIIIMGISLLVGLTACDNGLRDMVERAEPTPMPTHTPLTVIAIDNTAAGTTRTNGSDVQNQNGLNSDYQSASGDASRRVGLFVLKSGSNTTTASESVYERMNVACNKATVFADTWNKLDYTTNQLYYPDADAQPIDIYAYAPYKEDAQVADISRNEDVIPFTLESDQTTTTNYVASDILWGCVGSGSNVTNSVTNSDGAYNKLGKTTLNNNHEVSAQQYMYIRNTSSVGSGRVGGTAYYKESESAAHAVVPLLHRGAKVIVRCTTRGMDFARLKNATVQLRLPHLKGKLKISDGSFTVDDTEEEGAKAYTLTSHLGITAPGSTTTEEGKVTDGVTNYYECSAVVVPQTYTVNTDTYNMIEVDLYGKTTAHNDGTVTDNPMTATYGFHPAHDIEFKSGKKYLFTVTIAAEEMTVAVQVQDWSDGFTAEQKALEGTGKGSAALGLPKVGDLYFSDGTWGTKAWGDANGKTPIGIVFSTETSEKDKALGYHHGYVMALGQTDTKVLWAVSGEQTKWHTDLQISTSNKEKQWHQVHGDLDGLTHCRTAGCARGKTENQDKLPAMKAAMDYTPSAPDASSGWYLPSVGQMYQWLAAFQNVVTDEEMSIWTYLSDYQSFYIANQAQEIATAINSYLTGKGLDFTPFKVATDPVPYACYWSSTERAVRLYNNVERWEVFGWYMNGTGNNNLHIAGDHCKTEDALAYVRPVLAF